MIPTKTTGYCTLVPRKDMQTVQTCKSGKQRVEKLRAQYHGVGTVSIAVLAEISLSQTLHLEDSGAQHGDSDTTRLALNVS